MTQRVILVKHFLNFPDAMRHFVDVDNLADDRRKYITAALGCELPRGHLTQEVL
jgi:hypothetical protein